MRKRLRTAVIGTGHFGRHHAAKYAALPMSELIAVCDIDRGRREDISAAHGVTAVADYRSLAGRVDAVSIAVPTALHYEVARFFLENGVHVLLEKPMTDDLAAADHLIRLAGERGIVLQVGHLERFFAAEIGLQRAVTRPLYVEALRIAPFQGRGTDISVVLDSMIHDIDLVLALVSAAVDQVDAIGAPVLSEREDIANTRIRFANGCVASITASRISTKNERRLRVFEPDRYISVDFLARRVVTVRKGENSTGSTLPNLHHEMSEYSEVDPLASEIASFLETIIGGGEPRVSGVDGRRALAAAMQVSERLQEHLTLVRRSFEGVALPLSPPDVEAR
jgi:predicted dehydrogenase